MIPPAMADAFLAANGWGGAMVQPVAGDASFRRYFRVRSGGREAILMDAPPPQEDPRPFIAVAQWLGERGFAAPAIHAVDLDAGLVLLEDFGDVRMRETVDATPERASRLYGAAIDILVQLHRHPAAPLARYDRAVLHREADLLTEWYCPAIRSRTRRSVTISILRIFFNSSRVSIGGPSAGYGTSTCSKIFRTTVSVVISSASAS